MGRGPAIVGKTAEDKIVPAYLPAWQKLVGVTVERFGGESSEEEIQRLTKVAKAQGCDVVVGMGGGKAIDTAKAVGYAAQARVAIVPTIASTDAPTSAVAVIYTSDGAFLRYLFLPRNPDLVLVDTQVIAKAPCGTWSPAWAMPCPRGSRPMPAGRRMRPTSAAAWEPLPVTRWPGCATTRSGSTASPPGSPASRRSSPRRCPTSWRRTRC